MNPEAKIYQEQINNKATSFLSALDDFKKYYVYYNKNPEVQEYNKNFTDASQTSSFGYNGYLLSGGKQLMAAYKKS